MTMLNNQTRAGLQATAQKTSRGLDEPLWSKNALLSGGLGCARAEGLCMCPAPSGVGEKPREMKPPQ